MSPARSQHSPWPAAGSWLGGLAELADALRTPRAGADELAEARELLAYWEQRARRLPRWALMRRREAHAAARRWRERVRDAEQLRYGRGLRGAASQLALERRMPTALAHRGHQAARLAVYTAATAVITLLLVLAAALAVVAEAILGAL
jgi:hypothetical protein